MTITFDLKDWNTIRHKLQQANAPLDANTIENMLGSIKAGLQNQFYDEADYLIDGLEERTPLVVYHVFTHRQDEWFANLRDAKALYKEWSEAYGCARLYKQVYEYELEDDPDEEDCLEATGEFPF
jgi:hypothetical protein